MIKLNLGIGVCLALLSSSSFACVDLQGSWSCPVDYGDPLLSHSVEVTQQSTNARNTQYQFAGNTFPLDGLSHPFDSGRDYGISITTCEDDVLKVFLNHEYFQNTIVYSRSYEFKRVDSKLLVNQRLKLSEGGKVFQTSDYPQVICTKR